MNREINAKINRFAGNLANYGEHHDNLGYELEKKELIKYVEELLIESYNQCLVVECGEGECAEAIKTKFNLNL